MQTEPRWDLNRCTVVNEGQFRTSQGFTSLLWLCPEVAVDLYRELGMYESSSAVQKGVWSTEGQIFPVRYSHTMYQRILLELLAS